MSATHTPGPWHCNTTVPTYIYTEDGEFIAAAPGGSEGARMPHETRAEWRTRRDRYEANARLIAAAPDMLEFLKYVRTLHEAADLGPIEIRRRALDNLIAKAEGLS